MRGGVQAQGHRPAQAATQPAASEPGPSTPLPAKRNTCTMAKQAVEPTQPTKGTSKGKGKAAKTKAAQPGRARFAKHMRNLPTTYTSSGTQQHQVTSQCGLSASRDLGDCLASTSQQHRLVASVQSSVIGITQHRSLSIELERPPGPILIVDDLPLNRVVLSMMVKKAGLPVAFACNGLECVKAIQSQPPGSYCMILMDLHMPCMDGFTATQMLRRWETSLQPQHLQPQTLEPLSNQPHQQEQQEEDPPPPLCETQQPPNQTAASVHPRRRLPIVACTAELYGSPPLNEGHLPGGVLPGSTAASHALRCGADECVAKPLPFATLCSILRRYVPAWSLPPALAMPRVPASLPSAAPAQEPWLMQPMQLSSLSQQSDAEQVAKWGAELAARAGAPGHASAPVSQCLAAGSTEPGRQAGISQNVEDPLAAASCAVQARPSGAEVACHGGAEDGPGSPCASVSLHAMC
ncbi:hypothetical protein QJQ45_015678 [Haematococcus lacustris]|nr:hypothetical protein QJQ45_015678 [Haematococcus lacustris]